MWLLCHEFVRLFAINVEPLVVAAVLLVVLVLAVLILLISQSLRNVPPLGALGESWLLVYKRVNKHLLLISYPGSVH